MSGQPASSLRARAAAAHRAYSTAVEGLVDALGPGWAATREPAGDWSWAWFRRDGCKLPDQGWKLHVSATPRDAARLVVEALPALADLDVWFKLPDGLRGVVAFGSGAAGATQLGKMVTVYPADDEVFRAAARLLDEVWRPATAPHPPYDPRVGAGGGLSMRYGGQQRQDVIVDALGRPWSALRDARGDLHPDQRTGTPEWAPPPPVPATVHDHGGARRVFELDGRRYAAIRQLAGRDGAAVHAALDTEDLSVVLVRAALPGVGSDELGHDAVARLENEHQVLSRLNGAFGAPKVLGHDAEQRLLVTRDVGGRPLDEVGVEEGVTALRDAAEALAGLHSMGLVHRDVKPANILVAGSRVHLVDYELAAWLDADDQIIGGSAGYLPPGGEYADADPANDVYALGSSLTRVLLGSCPGRLPRQDNPDRQVALLRLSGQHSGAQLVAQLTDPDSARRPTAAEASRLLTGLRADLVHEHAAVGAPAAPDPDWEAGAATRAGSATRAFLVPDGPGHHWRNAHHFAPFACQSINIGAAGIIVGLCSIDTASGADEFAADVEGGATWLAAQPVYDRAHGLFTGNAGVALALALAGRRLGRQDLVTAARVRFTAAVGHERPDFDLFSGAAGIVVAGAALAGMLGESWPLDLAAGQVDRLHASVRSSGEVVGWPAGPDFDPSGTSYFGAAHGAAGIALALATWDRAAGAPASTRLAEETFVRLHTEATTPDGGFLADTTGRVFAVPAWCHGLTGLSWCLEQAFAESATLGDVRRWAAEGVLAAGPAQGDPTLCHGASGSLEHARLLGATTQAAWTGSVLRVLQQETTYGEVWSSEDPTTFTPDLWVGFLGPATQLAMHASGVADPVLSVPWLRRCAGR